MSRKKSPARQGNSNHNLNNITLSAQRQRLLVWLQEKPITTLQARQELNILSPAARVFELRHQFGFNIQTMWVEEFTPGGYKHRIAKYVLTPGRYQRHGGKRYE